MCASLIFMSKCHIFYFLYDRMAFNLILSLNFHIHLIAMTLQRKEYLICYLLYKEIISKQSKKIFSLFLCLYFVFDFAERYWTIVIVVDSYIVLISVRANPSISIRDISILCMHMSIKIPHWILSI